MMLNTLSKKHTVQLSRLALKSSSEKKALKNLGNYRLRLRKRKPKSKTIKELYYTYI